MLQREMFPCWRTIARLRCAAQQCGSESRRLLFLDVSSLENLAVPQAPPSFSRRLFGLAMAALIQPVEYLGVADAVRVQLSRQLGETGFFHRPSDRVMNIDEHILQLMGLGQELVKSGNCGWCLLHHDVKAGDHALGTTFNTVERQRLAMIQREVFEQLARVVS
jgi:hypothetical protein